MKIMKYEEVEVNSERWFDLTPLKNEEFRDIKGYEGLYQISNYGRVKSLEKTVNCTHNSVRKIKANIKNNLICKCGKNRVIYHKTSLSKNGKQTTKSIHRLVAEHFIPNPENKPTVDHIKPVNCWGCDNKVNNLRWATYSEQQRHSFDNCGKSSPMKGKINCYSCKKIAQYDDNNNVVKIFPSLHDIQRQLGYGYKCISSCCIKNKNDNKKHKSYGYVWKFVEGDK